MSLRILSLSDVKHSITMHQAISALESAFIQLANNTVKLPLRTGVTIEEENGLMLTMPGYLAQEKSLGLKVVSIFPENLAKNKPTITGFIMLLDATTGEAKVLMDAAYLTSLRTGAVSGLATKYFARDNATQVAIIGSGAQAKTQLEAVASVRDIQRVFVWSRNIKNAEKFANEFEDQFDMTICSSVAMAVKDADIICTATNSTEPMIHFGDISPHAHINAIGSHHPSMKEISHDVLSRAVVIADQLDAVLAESGEIISAVEHNHLKKESIIEIGQWLLQKNTDCKDKLTVFKSVGLAIQDLSVANAVYQNALKKNLGELFSIS
ncbi:ornithine cyclodeaminase family protein [Legionella pneumophila]|uniref:ornithine cyclodeaminase family protein n=1 Tax=Legionella pneumophila TaxID=446 RepID=UPI0007708510|nr:ornithine cyclodeaminase family protein [Legionella pneumophila]CZG94802.1 ornithine cyclodeaminase [Legionella pneumophila]HAT1981877.1 ornithine cyclodeaminase family protein [Legionella pneumophila]HAT4424215.1 ornithine cyclodeaminase family protein [Legionella pneumophila]HAU1719947.1 ornithine cyclodeaminase family protein [Legionella pneumophila]